MYKFIKKLLKPAPHFVLLQNSAGSTAGISHAAWRGYIPPGTVAVWKVRLKK